MSVFFAMIHSADGTLQPAFYLRRSQAPEGAFAISDRRHGELVVALSKGKTITIGKGGKPKVVTRRGEAGAQRAQLVTAVRREAARRIRAISPEWRQMNDLREPSDAGALRFARIDAIRAASDRIEELAESLAAADLTTFPVANHTLWPEFD